MVGKSKVDDNVLDAIEEALVASDMGVDTTLKIIDSLEERAGRDKYVSFDELVDMLRDEIGNCWTWTPRQRSRKTYSISPASPS